MARRKPVPQAKTCEEARATVIDPHVDDVRDFTEFYARNRPCTTRKQTLEYLNYLKFGVAHGLVSGKAANTQVYIISHIMMLLDRLEKDEGEHSELAKMVEDNQGTVNLTEEQMALITQQSSLKVQAQLFIKFGSQNKTPIVVPDVSEHKEKPIDVEAIYELAERKAAEESEGEGFV